VWQDIHPDSQDFIRAYLHQYPEVLLLCHSDKLVATFCCVHAQYNVCILPIMLYGSECWALSKADIRKIDALDQWCLRRILDIRWYHHVSNWEVWRLTEQPLLTSVIQKRRLMLFGHLIRMDESADARRILIAVPQSEPGLCASLIFFDPRQLKGSKRG